MKKSTLQATLNKLQNSWMQDINAALKISGTKVTQSSTKKFAASLNKAGYVWCSLNYIVKAEKAPSYAEVATITYNQAAELMYLLSKSWGKVGTICSKDGHADKYIPVK